MRSHECFQKNTGSILYLLEILIFWYDMFLYFHSSTVFVCNLAFKMHCGSGASSGNQGSLVRMNRMDGKKTATGGGTKTPTNGGYSNCFWGHLIPRCIFYLVVFLGRMDEFIWFLVQTYFWVFPQTSKGRVFNKGSCFHMQSKLHSVNMALSAKERNCRFQVYIYIYKYVCLQ